MMMHKSVVHRVAFVPVPLATKHAARSSQPRQQLTRIAVAAVEEPAIAGGSDEEFNKEEAYARFEKLLDEYTFNFTNGDKVRIVGALAIFVCDWVLGESIHSDWTLNWALQQLIIRHPPPLTLSCRFWELCSALNRRDAMSILEANPLHSAPSQNCPLHQLTG